VMIARTTKLVPPAKSGGEQMLVCDTHEVACPVSAMDD
jgi:hypothetical protein